MRRASRRPCARRRAPARSVRGDEPGGARGVAGLHGRDHGGRRGRDVGDRVGTRAALGRRPRTRRGTDCVRTLFGDRARREGEPMFVVGTTQWSRRAPACVRGSGRRMSVSDVQADLLSTYAVDLMRWSVSASLKVQRANGLPTRRTSSSRCSGWSSRRSVRDQRRDDVHLCCLGAGDGGGVVAWVACLLARGPLPTRSPHRQPTRIRDRCTLDRRNPEGGRASGDLELVGRTAGARPTT